MKKFVHLLLAAVFMAASFGTLHAQEQAKQRPTREQLSEAQAKHIAASIGLDEAASKKFVETYRRCQQEIWALGPENGKKRGKKDELMTDEEAKQAIRQRFDHSQKMLDIRKKYYDEYSKFLTQQQILRVYTLERKIMNKLSDRRKIAPRARK